MAENEGVKIEDGTPPSSPVESAQVKPDAQTDGAEAAISAALKANASSTSPATEDPQAQNEPTPDKPTDKTEEAVVDPKPNVDAPKPDDKGPVPYDRFAEVNQQKVQFEQQLQQFEPLARAHQTYIDFYKRNNITPEKSQYWHDVMAQVENGDPTKALELLKPVLTHLQSVVGEVLPPDLQKAVDAGEIVLEWAKKLAAAQGRQQVTQQQIAQAQQQAQQVALQQKQREFASAIDSWESTKRKSDPEFAPAKPGQPRGKFEMVSDHFLAMSQNATINSVHDIVALAEQCYAAVDASLKRFVPQNRNGKPSLRSSQSTTAPLAPPKNVDEAISRAAAKHGIAFTPRN